MSVKKILDKVLAKITPSRAEVLRLEKIAKELIVALKKKGVIAHIGGSLAKGTLLKTDTPSDVDIFVVFDYSEDIITLQKTLKKMKLPGPLKLVHGSRDYYQIDCKDMVLELIPVVKNKDPDLAENVTDVSLSHVNYVRSEIKKKPELAKEIMLAKAFCQANNVYGAESYIRGFSGYSLEVLVIYFGSFITMLKKIGKKKVYDPLKYYRGEKEVLREINASKLQGPLVVVDPTHKYRNVTAGLGAETYENFLTKTKEFLKKPSTTFFEKKKLDVGALKNFARNKKATFLELEIKTSRQEGDIAGTKMKKFFDFFVRELMRKGQEILRKEFDYSGSGQVSRGYVVVNEHKEITVRGPSIGLEEPARLFKKSRGKNAYKKGKYWFAREKTSVKEIFGCAKKFGKEMDVEVKLG